MSAPMPKTVGRYQILDRVAVGGMAELFKAQLTGQHGFEKLVAIKKILPHLANDRTFVEMFIDEARITAQLDHRNIVAVFELGTDADTPYIAMQFVDGLDVLGLLRECARTQIRLPPDIAALIARDVLDALDYAHRARDNNGRALEVIHRDISPGNVLLSWRGDVKLTDFGIARAVERQHKTEAGTLKGKYGYMSPEQVSGAEIDSRSDLFAVGILLAEMIMARRLFAASNDLDILLAVRDARLDRLHKYASEFPDGLRELVIRALQRRPELRWSTAAQFRDDIDMWLRRNTSTTHRDLAEFMAAVAAAPTAEIYEEIEGIPEVEYSRHRHDVELRQRIHAAGAHALPAEGECRGLLLDPGRRLQLQVRQGDARRLPVHDGREPLVQYEEPAGPGAEEACRGHGRAVHLRGLPHLEQCHAAGRRAGACRLGRQGEAHRGTGRLDLQGRADALRADEVRQRTE